MDTNTSEHVAKHVADDKAQKNSDTSSTHTQHSSALRWILVIICALIAALVVRVYVIEPYIVPSGSMENTIHVNDMLLGEKVSNKHSVKQGDIVTFKNPEDTSVIFIKRVIALPGQTVDIKDGALYVDGQRLNEPYTSQHETYPLTKHANNLSADIVYPYTVPDNCVWVMGDNRTNSLDSRYFGPVPIDNITSKALFTYWPLNHIRTL